MAAYWEGGGSAGGLSWYANATGNSVNISGGTIKGRVYGGYSSSANATGNTVRISGAPVFDSVNTTLFGGYSYGATDFRTGNTLELHTKGITVAQIKNFENLYFYLPAASIANGDTVLTLADPGGSDISGSTVGVGMEGGGSPLKVGDKVTLIQANGGLTTDATNLVNTTTGMQGISLLYGFNLSATANTLDATVTKTGMNPQTKSLLEGRLAGLALINQGADLAADVGLREAVATAQKDTSLFAVMSGGSNRYKTGSHVDQDSFNLMLGASTRLPNAAGALTLGGFVEAGWGDYDSYNSFVNAPSVHAHGKTDYVGAGVLAQQDIGERLYVQGSARFGRLKTTYHSADLHSALGLPTDYSSRRSYAGLHAGVGYVLPVGSQGDKLDMYGKLFWNRYGSDSQTIQGDVFHFDSLESVRTRLGVRYTHPFSAGGSVYGGLAWEHEFRGVGKGQVFSLSLLEPRLRGSSAMLEGGVKFSQSSNKNLTLEAGLRGYAGKRRGVMANVKLKYAF